MKRITNEWLERRRPSLDKKEKLWFAVAELALELIVTGIVFGIILMLAVLVTNAKDFSVKERQLPYIENEYRVPHTVHIDTVPSEVKDAEPVEEAATPATDELVGESVESAEVKAEEADLPYSEYDVDLLARCVWLEARGEPYEGQVAVAEVILNRVRSKNYPDTVEGVIWDGGQFASAPMMGRATPTDVQYQAVYDALNGMGVLNNDRCVFFSVGRSYGSYYTTIGNHVFGLE